jgi:hypothetical protein
MSTIVDPYAETETPEPEPRPRDPGDQPERDLPPQEPDPAEAPPTPPLTPDPTAPESFRKTPLKGRMPKIEVFHDGIWVPLGVWTFENYPHLSGDALRELLISKGLPEADAKWFGIQRALRLAKTKELSS